MKNIRSMWRGWLLVLAVICALGLPYAALTIDGTGTFTSLGPHRTVSGTQDGENNDPTAGTLNFQLNDSGATVPTFCIDLQHHVDYNDTFITSDEAMPCSVLWLLTHYPPRLSESSWPDDSPGALDDISDEMAARQAAVWHFSDNYMPDNPGGDIENRAWEIINAVPENPCQANQPAIDITPGSAVNPAGETQVFTVTVSQGNNPVNGQTVNIAVDHGTPATTTLTTDAQGQATFTLTYENPDVTSHITATSQMPLPVGTIFIGTEPNKQKLVLGEETTGLVQQHASARWTGTGTVTTLSFADYDMDGVHDSGEPALEGWTVTLQEYESGTWSNYTAPQSTGSDGRVHFSGLSAGQYRVIETVKSGWHATTSTSVTFDLAPDESHAVDFGQVKLPVIIGHVYQDDNLDATYNPEELSLEDWELRLYREDGSEVVGMQGLTGADGKVVFSSPPDRDPPDITAGTYVVKETLQEGWIATDGISRSVTVDAGDVAEVHIGNYALKSVRPILECVTNNFDGTYTAYFGYKNENPFAIDIPTGDENHFSPAPQDRGQPTTFAPGRTPYWPNADYAVSFEEHQTLVWQLDGRTATASRNATPCSNHVFFDKVWYDVSGTLLTTPPANIDTFEITAESEIGTATCTYPEGATELVCEYDNPAPALDNNGLWVPVGTTYTVTESGLPAGWVLGDGAGTYTVEDGYCVPGVEGFDKYCLHTIKNQDVAPTISIEKSANPASVPETGGDVGFTITVSNDSAEAVTITDFTDSDFDLSAHCADAVGTSLDVDATYICTFTEFITGNVSGSAHQNTASATAEDDEGNTASDSDTATVTFSDVLPAISVEKSPNPTSVSETGGDVEFTITVSNDSAEPVTITDFTDSNFDLSTHCADAIGTSLDVDATYICTFTEFITGNASGSAHQNTASATAEDDEGNTASDSDTATVAFTDVLPAISVEKTANPTEVPEPGGMVEFSVTVTNTTAEELILTSLVDDIHGDLDDYGDCSIPQTIPAGESYTCSFIAEVYGEVGDTETDTITATVADDDSNEANGSDTATVTIVDNNAGSDEDGDGTPGYQEPDSDGDGIPDSQEGAGDVDGDGTPDYQDPDSDGDGIPDGTEAGADPTNPVDTDGDGTPDYQDPDSDGDGIPDGIEAGADPTNPVDTDGDGTPDYQDPDSDGDGIPDSEEAGSDPTNPVDTDGDGTPDYQDPDSDGDGIPDSEEAGNDPTNPLDTDGDGTPDYQDADSDGDGIPDSEEAGSDPTNPVDTDSDGTPDYQDSDSDGDGIPDSEEAGNDPTNPVDTDEDGIPDYQDLDSDGDGIPDAVEYSEGAEDGFCAVDVEDTDGDGTNNCLDNDVDGDGIPNYQDLDSDGDGIPDADEFDRNHDGIADDSDEDGIPDWLDPDEVTPAEDLHYVYMPAVFYKH